MTVYFLRAGDDGPVKIGWTVSLVNRISLLQCANPVLLKVIRTIDGDRKVEGWAHSAFRALRLRGEWFRYDDSMLAWEPRAPAAKQRKAKEWAGRKEKKCVASTPFGQEISELRGSLDLSREAFAALFPVDPVTVWRWETGRRQSHSKLLFRIIERLKRKPTRGKSNGKRS